MLAAAYGHGCGLERGKRVKAKAAERGFGLEAIGAAAPDEYLGGVPRAAGSGYLCERDTKGGAAGPFGTGAKRTLE